MELKMGTWNWALTVLIPLIAGSIFMFSSSMASSENRLFRIDTHSHILPPFYKELLISKGLTSGGFLIPEWNVEEHIAVMDSMNIELSVLSVSSPGARTPSDTVEEGRKLARQLNEYTHMVTEKYPGRFQFFATLTLPDVEGSIAEAIYSLDTLKAAGVVLLANSQGEYLGSKNFDPLLEVLNVRNATVFIHPSHLDSAAVTNDVGGGKQVKLPPYLIDFLLDTTRAAANLVLMNVPRRYPNVKFLLAHSGGFLPYAAYRMLGALSQTTGTSPEAIMEQLKSFYLDLAISATPSALPSILAFIPHHQITYGSDYPYVPLYGIRLNLMSFEKLIQDESLRHDINFLCANRLFETPLQHWRSVWQQGPANRNASSALKCDEDAKEVTHQSLPSMCTREDVQHSDIAICAS